MKALYNGCERIIIRDIIAKNELSTTKVLMGSIVRKFNKIEFYQNGDIMEDTSENNYCFKKKKKKEIKFA